MSEIKDNKNKKDNTAKILLICAVFIFIASAIFTGINVSYMRKCELNYYKTTAEITKLTTEHVNTNNKKDSRYCFTYGYTTEDGAYREVVGKRSMNKTSLDPYKIYVGEKVEIYVDTATNEAIPVDGGGYLFSNFCSFICLCGSSLRHRLGNLFARKGFETQTQVAYNLVSCCGNLHCFGTAISYRIAERRAFGTVRKSRRRNRLYCDSGAYLHMRGC